MDLVIISELSDALLRGHYGLNLGDTLHWPRYQVAFHVKMHAVVFHGVEVRIPFSYTHPKMFY